MKLDEQGSIVLNFLLSIPKTIIELPTKSYFYIDNNINDANIIKNTAKVDFGDKNLDNVRFVKLNSTPAVGERLTAQKIMLTKLFFKV